MEPVISVGIVSQFAPNDRTSSRSAIATQCVGLPHNVTALADLCTVRALKNARMKLTSFRDTDRMHLQDMLDVGLLDESWNDRFPKQLAARWQLLIEDPDG